MKPYQGILALIGYLVLQILVARFISVEYYEPIAGIIALIVLGCLLHKKRMLHLSSRDLKGSQLLFCVGIPNKYFLLFSFGHNTWQPG